MAAAQQKGQLFLAQRAETGEGKASRLPSRHGPEQDPVDAGLEEVQVEIEPATNR